MILDSSDIKYLQPQIAAGLGSLKIIARAIVEGYLVGLHKSPMHGFSAEFSEYRQYLRGDDLRLIDWKVAARTEKLFVKRFEDETNLSAHLVLDISESMKFSSGKVSKFDYARYLVAALSYLLYKQRDNFSLTVFNDKPLFNTPLRHSFNHLSYIYDFLENLVPTGKTSLFDAFKKSAELINGRGLTVVVSDLLFEKEDDIKKGLLYFKNQHSDLIVFHIADPEELDFNYNGETVFVDMESGEKIKTNPVQIQYEVNKELKRYYREIKIFCLNHKIEYQLINIENSFIKMLTSFLIYRNRLKLK